MWILAYRKAYIYKLAYDSQFRPYSPGTLLTAHMMRRAFESEDVAEVDYLIGDDAYKKDWMGDRRERWRIVAYNPRTAGGLLGLSRGVLARGIKPLFARPINRDRLHE
jgi:CelD/BcsL family acetyltransferase involved in cellulose biosynthesis